MALVLRQSTATDVLIGPFVDSTDGVTAETALTISQADVLLSKNGQALTQKTDVTAAAHDSSGYYNCELDATDTATVGTLVLAVSESGALPVRHEFQVIEEAAYDAMYAASAVGPLLANSNGSGLTEAGGTGDHLTAINLPNQTMDITGNITGNLSGSVGSVTGAVGSVTGNVGGTVNGLTATAQGNVRTAVGLASANLDTQLTAIDNFLDTEIAAIKAVTDNLPDSGALTSIATAAALATVDGNVDAILVDTGTTLDGKLNTIDDFLDTEIAAIKAQTDKMTFTVANQVDVNIQSINDVAITGNGAAGTEFSV